VTDYSVRPGLPCSAVWHPSRPVGIQQWRPGEAELKYRLGKAQPRKRSTDTETVCIGGPYHGERVQSRWYRGRGEQRHLVAELPDSFTCTPWRGTYQWVRDRDVLVWCDETISRREHLRLLAEYERKSDERRSKREAKREES
jgi:hypothetical protein